MKTVCKKLLSIMLVAILLVSAVPFMASAVEGAMNITVQVIDQNTDRTIETLGPVEIMPADYEALGTTFTDAKELLEELDSAYANITSDDFVRMAKFTNQILITIKSVTNDEGENVKPPVTGNTEKFTLTVNVGGSYTLDAYEGQLYVDVLKGKEPARPGQTFLGWKSAKHGPITATTVVDGNDTVTALWSDPVEYSLTLDPNRGLAEDVNYGVKVAYGEEIYEKVMKYKPERKGYVFMGWKLNGTIIDEETVYELQGDATAYAVWKLESDTEDEPMNGTHTKDGKVYLEIYVDGDTSKVKKSVEITKYADDNKISRAEVESVVKQYVTPKAGYSLVYVGLFDEESWWWYTRDEETDGENEIVVNMDGDDYVYVMVNNVKAVAADPTNPKTGDMIGVSLALMMSTGGAALMLGKKRKF